MASRRKRVKAAIGRSIFPILREATTPLTFMASITSGAQEQADLTAAPDLTSKAKIIANIVTGRVTGINFFGGTTPQYGAMQKPQAIMSNPWVKTGGYLLLYGAIGGALKERFNIPIPETAKAKAIAKRMIVGGAVGAYFDGPDDPNNPMASMQQQPQQQQAIIRPGNVSQAYASAPYNPLPTTTQSTGVRSAGSSGGYSAGADASVMRALTQSG